MSVYFKDEVRLTAFLFPCVTYVLERVGVDQSPEEFMRGIGWKLSTFTRKDVQVGDIVCWNKDQYLTDVTLEIVGGVPVSERIVINNHYGVYEGNGLVSDLTINGDNYAPRIRVMSVDRSRTPDFIVRRK